MRYGWMAAGLALGAGAYYWYTTNTPEAQERRRFSRPLQRRHDIQDPEAHEAVAHLVDEVVHSPDAPDTPIKQAFEHALEGK